MNSISFAEPRTIGGVTSTLNEFIYQVILEYNNGTYRESCGGVILSTIFILTAAHCVHLKEPYFLSVIAEEHHKKTGKRIEQKRIVSRFEIHENYIGTPDYKHNIALLILSEPLKFNEYVNNIHYSKIGMEFKGKAVAVSWTQPLYNSSVSTTLQELQILPTKHCRKPSRTNYSSDVKEREHLSDSEFLNDIICAKDGKRDCKGETNGVLLCAVKSTTEIVLCGIKSQCGNLGLPSTYTKVSSYASWIVKTVQKLINCSSSDEFRCLSRCLQDQWVCDGENDCENGEDELNCSDSYSNSSTTSEPLCDSNFDFLCFLSEIPICINPFLICDGNEDCEHGEDEWNCTSSTKSTNVIPLTTCDSDSDFICKFNKDPKCISASLVCNGEKECENGEDEFNCRISNISVIVMPSETPSLTVSSTPTTTTTVLANACGSYHFANFNVSWLLHCILVFLICVQQL